MAHTLPRAALVTRLRTLYARTRYAGATHYCPICAADLSDFLPAGRNQRPNALCPVCGSLERHRLIWLLWRDAVDLFADGPQRMLHVAPEPCLEQRLRSIPQLRRITVDLVAPASARVDLTQLAFADNSFDMIYASHVLEHIPNDRAAMAELRRVLRPGGWAILQVPLADAEHTDEDASVIDPAERERRFGQRDHVRLYGRDYYGRLAAAGLRVERRQVPAQRDPAACIRYGLDAAEEVTLCFRD